MQNRQIEIDTTLATTLGEAAYRICEQLLDNGFEAWWVGGGVRDIARGLVPTDIDIATDAHPEQVQKIFKKVDLASAALGSVLITLNTHTFEVTTFREDDEASDGRHPESVVFGSLQQDSRRRDFTINAIYCNPITRSIYDPHAGLGDLKEKLIRFIGEPGIRIRHDVLRMLRAVRFRALIDGQYHPATYRAIQEQAASIAILSGSRVLAELERMLIGPHPSRALEDLWELGLLTYLIPELHACKGIPQPADFHREGDVWDHLLKCINACQSDHGADVRIAALFHDIGKAQTFSLAERIQYNEHASASGDLARSILHRLQCPGKRIEKIDWLIRHHMMLGELTGMEQKRKAHWYYHPWFNELLQLFWLDIAGTLPADFSLYDAVVRDYQHFLDSQPRIPAMLLSGADIMEHLGISPGKMVGIIVQKLREAQISHHIETKKQAIEFIKRCHRELGNATPPLPQ